MLNPDVIDTNAHEGSQSAPESDAQPEGDASRDAEGSPPVAAHPEHTLGAPRERQYEQHELSSLFPRMEAGAFARLVVNISQQGLLESITIYEGKILDGFHRDEACFVAGKQPTYVDLDPSLDAFEFVFGKNMERRQMTVSQISVVMAKGATHPRGRQSRRHSSNAGKPEMDKNVHLEMIKEPEGVVIGEARVDTGGSEERDTTDDADPLAWANPSDDADAFDSSIAVTRMEPPEPEAAMMTNAQAAKMAGVSRSSIKIAKRLINADNELLLDAVMQHSMSGGHALALLALPVDDQIQAVNQFIEGKKEGEKRKMVKADAKKAVEKSKKVNGGIDVTCVVPGESPLSTVLRVINGLDWAISYFKTEVPNEEMQNRYEKLLARAKALIDNDPFVKKSDYFLKGRRTD